MNKFFQILLLGVCTFSIVSAQTAIVPSAGDGSAGNPYQIASLENLYWITADASRWEYHYIQTADIDADATTGWDSGNGWKPIGNTVGTPFSGSYDGQGHTISNLSMSRSGSDGQGLFGYIRNDSEPPIIQNVRVMNVNITGWDQIGGLAASCENYVVVSNCFSTGTITGNSFIGGLVGNNFYSTVKNSSSTCNVSGVYNVGGLVAYNHGTSSFISGCYSTGSVTGTGNSIGGLVGGILWGNVSDCYSTSTVSGTFEVGGLIGKIDHGIVTACYSMGSVSGGSSIGGLVGNNEADFGTVANCFWNTQTSGQTSSSAGTGKTTAEMTTDALVLSYETNIYLKGSWDFKDETTNGENKIWNIGNGRNNGYPYLDWQFPADDGTLPVELASFTVTNAGSTAMLNWQTTTEVNNYGFEIERRPVKSEESTVKSWQRIGFVKGNGTSNTSCMYGFTDSKLSAGRFVYRLKQIDTDGSFQYSGTVELSLMNPSEYALNQNYPNPFNPSTTIQYGLPSRSIVRLVIYNLLGRVVQELVNSEQQTGIQSVIWNATVSSGIYFYTLEAASLDNPGKRFVETKKMLLLK
jgi:hypothetical protein